MHKKKKSVRAACSTHDHANTWLTTDAQQHNWIVIHAFQGVTNFLEILIHNKHESFGTYEKLVAEVVKPEHVFKKSE